MTITTRHYDFNTVIQRRGDQGVKWNKHDADVLPLWVAEMDFQSPPEMLDAIRERVDYGIFGYMQTPNSLKEVIIARMKRLYNWDVKAEWLVFNPGMVLMLNVVAQAVGKDGDGILMNTPVYGPFYRVAYNRRRFAQGVDMVRVDDDANTFHYDINFDAFEAAITRQTSLYFLCDPHNPAGKIFTREEHERLAEICLKHDIVIAADSIHCDLLLDDNEFQPLATLSPEVADRTITMISASKTYNIPGLACSVAIVPNEDIRKRMTKISYASGYHVNTLAYTAMQAAYEHGDGWLHQLRGYLTENRNLVVDFIREQLPQLKTTVPQATYLAWIDGSAVETGDHTLQEYFLEKGRLAFSPGNFFGNYADHFVRLNFACPREVLREAFSRKKSTLELQAIPDDA